MIFLIIASVINIILDPLMIKGYWIFPKMEIKGDAWATILAQTFVLILLIVYVQKKYYLLFLKGVYVE